MKLAELLQGELARKWGLPYSPSVFSRAWRVRCLAEAWRLAAGMACGEGAGVRIAEALDQRFGVVVACYGLGLLYLPEKAEARQGHALLNQSLSLCRSAQTLIVFSPGWQRRWLLCIRSGDWSRTRWRYSRRLWRRLLLRKIACGHAASVVHLSEASVRAGQMDEATEVAHHAVHLARGLARTRQRGIRP